MKNVIKCFANKMNEIICLFQTCGYEISGFKIFRKHYKL